MTREAFLRPILWIKGLFGARSFEEREQLSRALWRAVDAGEAKALAKALKRGARVDAIAVDGRTKSPRLPILAAAAAGSASVMQELIAAGADIHATTDAGDGILTLAFKSRRGRAIDCAMRLALADSSRRLSTHANKDGETPLLWAAALLPARASQTLLGLGADPAAEASDGRSPLRAAIEKGDDKLARLFLEAGARFQTGSSKPMASEGRGLKTLAMLAERSGNPECLRLLASEGVDLDEEAPGGSWAASEACKRSRSQLRELLLLGASRSKKTRDGFSPLGLAAALGFPEHVRELLARGADPSRCGPANASAFHLACDWGPGWAMGPEVIRELARFGADPNLLDETGRAPASLALRRSGEILKAILSSGADLEKKSRGVALVEEACLWAPGKPLTMALPALRILAAHGATPTPELIEAARLAKRQGLLGEGHPDALFAHSWIESHQLSKDLQNQIDVKTQTGPGTPRPKSL